MNFNDLVLIAESNDDYVSEKDRILVHELIIDYLCNHTQIQSITNIDELVAAVNSLIDSYKDTSGTPRYDAYQILYARVGDEIDKYALADFNHTDLYSAFRQIATDAIYMTNNSYTEYRGHSPAWDWYFNRRKINKELKSPNHPEADLTF